MRWSRRPPPGPRARAAVEPTLIAWQADPDTAALVAALQRILDGTDDPTHDTNLPAEQTAFLTAVRKHLTLGVAAGDVGAE